MYFVLKLYVNSENLRGNRKRAGMSHLRFLIPYIMFPFFVLTMGRPLRLIRCFLEPLVSLFRRNGSILNPEIREKKVFVLKS
jgi:hypothetical protein